MGFGTVAGTLIVLVALAASGTILAGAVSNAVHQGLDSTAGATDRFARAANERFTLAGSGYASGADRTFANWTNDGSREVALSLVTLLVGGVVTAPAAIERFEVADASGSDLWMPGETLEVRVQGAGDVDVTIVGPHGVASHRRA